MQRDETLNCCILVDFDGTVAPDDPTDRLFERFADPAWRDIESAWQGGEISSHDCLTRQVALLRATPGALDAEIRTVRMDPGFAIFIEFCRRHGIEVKIVSDGFDRVIRSALCRARLSVPFFANKLEWQGGDQWRLALPHFRGGCRVSGANCKCSHTQWSPLQLHVVVGDGRSDFCMSMQADFIIAKGALATFCRQHKKPFAPFADFYDVTAGLSAWLGKSSGAPRPTPSSMPPKATVP